LTVHYIKTY